MDTASLQFVVFGLAVALTSNISRAPLWRSIVQMSASFIFIGLLARSPIACVPVSGFLLIGYIGIFLIERGFSKSFVLSIFIVVLTYVWLKKYTFLPDSVFIDYPYFTIGLSYIFFRVLHLLIETVEGGQRPHVGLGAYLLYTLNFTTFICGPIQRYDEFAQDQFACTPIALGPGVVGSQLERIVLGFFKVNVLAMVLHSLHENALARMYESFPISVKIMAALQLIVVYPLFLYSNFSGYMDIVIALSRLMRVRLPENFNRPFSASSVLEFWNRWHITLANWVKAYVYNPLLLALMRRIRSSVMQPFLGVFCYFVTFFLVGVWHGRTSEFVFFGILTGGGLSVNKLWQLGLTRTAGRSGYKELVKNPAYEAFGRGLNFTWFAFTCFWFWGGWNQIGTVFSALDLTRWLGIWLAVWLIGTAVLAFWEWLRATLLSLKTSGGPLVTCCYTRVVFATAVGLVAFVSTILLNQPAPGIVYKMF